VSEKKVCVLHIITSLKDGGAEMMLLKLLSTTNKKRFHSVVISLAGRGELSERFDSLGIPIYSLDIKPSAPNPLKLVKLTRLIKSIRPSVVQTWMYHADLIGGTTARIAGVDQVVWNIRNSGLEAKSTKWSTRIVVSVCAIASHVVPRSVITNSKTAVITNGFDTEKFKPSQAARLLIRKELGLPNEAKLIGLVARFHPQKSHLDFLKAASILNERRNGQIYVLVGRNVNEQNSTLTRES